jgi:glucose/arabinose dehydrogenase
VFSCVHAHPLPTPHTTHCCSPPPQPSNTRAAPNRSWKFIRFGPDGRLYLPIGAPCNVCRPGTYQ